MPQLSFLKDGKEHFNFRILRTGLSIGRGEGCDITIQSPTISRIHFTLKEEGGVYTLVDSSKNGTFVNGRRVGSCVLKDGDRVTFSGWEARFIIGEERWGGERTISEIHKGDGGAAGHPHSPLAGLQEKYPDMEYFYGMITRSEVIKDLFRSLRRMGEVEEPVLILGETGTGKELVARAIHRMGPRAGAPFVTINCGAIVPELFESELFGHVKGAFTGAVSDRAGAFERGGGGTIFLDEVGDLPLQLQVKLLRVLESKEIKRVGSSRTIHVDVRVIGATNRRLDMEVEKGNFREDLFYRLYILPVILPPLRERAEDIPLLIDYFLATSIPEGNPVEIEGEALDLLLSHGWPGNIRELRNVITRTILLGEGGRIGVEDINFLPFRPGRGDEGRRAGSYLRGREKEEILKVLERCEWNRTQAARILGISRSTLFKKIDRYGLKKG